MALEDLLNSILQEAREKAEQIVSGARAEATQWLAQQTRRSAQEARHIQEEELQRCQRTVNQQLSHIRLTWRKRWLETQQELLDQVFQEAASQLEQLSAQQYRTWIASQLAQAWDGKAAVLLLPEQHRNRLGEDFQSWLHQQVRKQGDPENLQIQWQPLEGGGFVLSTPRSDLVFTFAQRLEEVRRNQLHQLAQILFAGVTEREAENP